MIMLSQLPPFLSFIRDLTLGHFDSQAWAWDMTKLASFMQARPTLLSLSLASTISRDCFVWQSDSTVVHLPQLKSLMLASADLTAMADMIRGLSIPSLTSLSLSMDKDSDGGDLTHTLVFLDPFLPVLIDCSPTLKHFNTNFDQPFHDLRMKSLVASLPSLIYLSVTRMYSLRDWTDIFKLTFEFDDDNRLKGGRDQNITLQSLFIDLDDSHPGINDSDDEAEFEEYCEVLAAMVRSRCVVPDNATSRDGRHVARLERFGTGYCMKALFEVGPASEWDSVKQSLQRIAEFVDPTWDEEF